MVPRTRQEAKVLRGSCSSMQGRRKSMTRSRKEAGRGKGTRGQNSRPLSTAQRQKYKWQRHADRYITQKRRGHDETTARDNGDTTREAHSHSRWSRGAQRPLAQPTAEVYFLFPLANLGERYFPKPSIMTNQPLTENSFLLSLFSFFPTSSH